jgi:hypothetical protein
MGRVNVVHAMSIVRHDSSSILSNAVEHGGNVYLAGVEIMVVAAK